MFKNDYYGRRFYNATTGRWLKRDPIGELGRDGSHLYGFVRNDPLDQVDVDGLETWLPGWNPYGPPYLPRPPSGPKGPGFDDQVNPLGNRGNYGDEDYTDWFNQRFPRSVEGAQELLKKRIKEWISMKCSERPSMAPGAKNGSEIQDVDIRPDMKRFGDLPQGSYERMVVIGFFEFRADPARIRWVNKHQFCFETKMYVWEQTGADTPIGGLFLFNKRFVRMAEWSLQGCGNCPCNKYAR